MIHTHDGFHAFEAELVLEGDWEAMQWSDHLSVRLHVVINFLSALEGTFDEDLCQTVGLRWKM